MIGGILLVLGATGWTLVYHLVFSEMKPGFTFALYLGATAFMLFTLGAAFRGRSFTHLPVPDGRTIVIVPSFNEDPVLLEKTVRTVIEQSYQVAEIHVIDDGSTEPLVTLDPVTGKGIGPFEHPLVTWHRQVNGGKRHAQATVLRTLDWSTIDFIVTIDSDAVLDVHAIRECLRALSDKRVQASTGLPLVLNRTQSLLTRVVDLEMVTWCLVTRVARSILGAVAPTSGVLAVYRSAVVFDNLDDYVSSGTIGDDRRLTHYALERGQVVAVNEAIVHTEMPSTIKGTFRQRTRWFRSYWGYILWEIRNFRKTPLSLRMYSLIFTLCAPMIYAYILIVLPEQSKMILLQGLGYWVIMTYAQTGMYAIHRPGVSLPVRIFAWLALTPLITVFGFFLVKPAMYWALIKVRDTGWATRGEAVEDVPSLAVAGAVR